jgi:hypothetical protein
MPGHGWAKRVLLTSALIHISGVEMIEHTREMTDEEDGAHLAVDMRVRVYPGTDAESRGIVVDDFGETAGCPVDIGENHIADPARRWAVLLDTGALVFIDSDQLAPE